MKRRRERVAALARAQFGVPYPVMAMAEILSTIPACYDAARLVEY
jgi:hypothetical protein